MIHSMKTAFANVLVGTYIVVLNDSMCKRVWFKQCVQFILALIDLYAFI